MRMIACKQCWSVLLCSIIAVLFLPFFAQGAETIRVGTTNRTAIIHVPQGLSSNRPLLISLHGMNQNAGYQQSTAKWEEVADTAQFAVVYPEGEGASWDISGQKDINFILAIIDTMHARHAIDVNRVYVSGFSMGGMMSYHVANNIAHKVAAIGPVSGYLFANPVSSSRPMPIIHVHGTTDDVVGYSGVAGIIEKWRNWNSCPNQAQSIDPYPSSKPNSSASRDYWGPCENNSAVALITIEGKGHWHSNDLASVHTSEEIWNFVKTFSLGAPGPEIRILSPENNAYMQEPANIELTVAASVDGGSIEKVEFYNGDNRIGEAASSPFSFTWNAGGAGSYELTAVAVDSEGNSTTSQPVTIHVHVAQAPYASSIAIPGILQAENYDLGGQGVAYNDMDSENKGSEYRDDGVDITANDENGYSIGWTEAGEWLEYSVQIEKNGVYTWEARVASGADASSFKVQIANEDVIGTVSIPNTGDWETYTTLQGVTSYLEVGEYVLRLQVEGSYFNMDWIAFSLPGSEEDPTNITHTNEMVLSPGRDYEIFDVKGNMLAKIHLINQEELPMQVRNSTQQAGLYYVRSVGSQTFTRLVISPKCQRSWHHQY
jgi:poly(3-hydroxybutyrate) depolymerase